MVDQECIQRTASMETETLCQETNWNQWINAETLSLGCNCFIFPSLIKRENIGEASNDVTEPEVNFLLNDII